MRRCISCGQSESGTIFPCKSSGGHLWDAVESWPVLSFSLTDTETLESLREQLKAADKREVAYLTMLNHLSHGHYGAEVSDYIERELAKFEKEK